MYYIISVSHAGHSYHNILFVCLSVCLSHWSFTPNKTVQCAPHDRMMLLVLEAKFYSPEFNFRGSPRTRGLNRGTAVKSDNLNQYSTITRKRCARRDKFVYVCISGWFVCLCVYFLWTMLPSTHKYLLFTYKKSYTGLRLVPKSVTLSDLERLPSGRYYALFHTKLHLSKPTARQIHCVKTYSTVTTNL